MTAESPESSIVEPTCRSTAERAGDGVLKIGSLLPETGSLAFLGPPEFAGSSLAIDEINKAGGVLGKPVEYSQGDSGDTSTDTATRHTEPVARRTSPTSWRKAPAAASRRRPSAASEPERRNPPCRVRRGPRRRAARRGLRRRLAHARTHRHARRAHADSHRDSACPGPLSAAARA